MINKIIALCASSLLSSTAFGASTLNSAVWFDGKVLSLDNSGVAYIMGSGTNSHVGFILTSTECEGKSAGSSVAAKRRISVVNFLGKGTYPNVQSVNFSVSCINDYAAFYVAISQKGKQYIVDAFKKSEWVSVGGDIRFSAMNFTAEYNKWSQKTEAL
ncbi:MULTISPECIES: hypothetical protein [Vibrio]|uniref:hypothetical protein n=1 Tax=Vibrio TaxID=662 RepID=UPI002964054D|nr:hypothetical protein [Vibrio sp. YT-19(2023)]EJA7361176.1 hypothetical protein [Vibrio alginolyticus]MDW1501128.1 hypothetical protein [Vibrio sp. YT-19(2023)]